MNVLNPLRLTIKLQSSLVSLADLERACLLSEQNARLSLDQMASDTTTLLQWVEEQRAKLGSVR